ncbi:hypothetical protein FACS189472_06950 [Alphaproteobacteria bacterium]|nr:hypothetical protein FACS189472_06950 [Alphaproteobacteria bacterium]
MTIGAGPGVTEGRAEKVHNQIRGGMTGGLSNVWHRRNIAGETKIKHLYVEEYADPLINKQLLYRVVSRDSKWTMTHVIGIDFNSLYPFSMGSVRAPWNPYQNGIMYMPGNLKEYSDDPVRARELFESMFNQRYHKTDADAKRGCLFAVTVKAHMPQEHCNEFINFPPVF